MMSALPIYLVDDEEAIRRSLKLVLQLAGHDVIAFESGRHFLDAVGQLATGCILLDVRMPEIDGLQVQQALIDRGIDMPVVIMTGHGDLGVAVTALKHGADDFVEKPFERSQMLAAIERACLRADDPEAFRGLVSHARAALDRLGETERAILDQYATGQASAGVAAALGMKVDAVEMARITLIVKIGASGLTDAIRLVFLTKSEG
jgi:two-component system response regulator FixJ